jgi:hypothetical protein
MNILNVLFNELKRELKRDDLKMDFNSIYGGYRIDIVNKDTSENFFYLNNRISKKEMISHLQGILYGIAITKK